MNLVEAIAKEHSKAQCDKIAKYIGKDPSRPECFKTIVVNLQPPSLMNEPSAEHTCKSCGNHFKGNYCNECGEKVLLAEDRSFKTFVSNILIAITFADSKLVTTMWLVISKPGFISDEYAGGRRVKYLRPISLFFVFNLIYFLFPVIQLFNASLNTQLLAPQRELVRQMVAHKMVNLQMMDIASFSLIYNQKTTILAKLMVMVFVVIGLAFYLFFCYCAKRICEKCGTPPGF